MAASRFHAHGPSITLNLVMLTACHFPSRHGHVPQVEVKFDIDANGLLSVTATDKGTGKKQVALSFGLDNGTWRLKCKHLSNS